MIESFLITPIKFIFKILYNLITGKSYEYLLNNPLIKYSLGIIITIVAIISLILILINSFKGISYLINDFFNLDLYKYINVLDIDLEDNFNKLYLPEFIISCIGLACIICILLYIISSDKFNNKPQDLNIPIVSNMFNSTNITPILTNSPNISTI